MTHPITFCIDDRNTPSNKLQSWIEQLQSTITLPCSSILALSHLKLDPTPYTLLSAVEPATDIILLKAGLILPYAWDLRLQKTAYTNDNIGIVSPLCNARNDVSLFDTNDLTLDANTIDRLVYYLSDHHFFELSTYLPNCSFIRHQVVQQTTAWLTVACDHVYIAQPTTPTISPHPRINSALTTLRQRLQSTLHIKPPPYYVGLTSHPVQLHITHSWEGGIDHWLNDYIQADQQHINLILRSKGSWDDKVYGQILSLHTGVDSNHSLCLGQWALPFYIDASIPTNASYQTILQHIIHHYCIDHILISSFVGHALDVMTTPITTSIIGHDFFPFCAKINLHFNQVCQRCEQHELSQCLKYNPINRTLFGKISAATWQQLRQHFFDNIQHKAINFITPSMSVYHYLRQINPMFQHLKHHCIPHGMTKNMQWITPYKHRRKLQVVILGRLTVEKGRELLTTALPSLTHFCDVHLVGCQAESALVFTKRVGIKSIHPHYHSDELYSILNKIKPDCGLLLSIWPETFCYTLSELMMIGIPPIATNIGSFQERIQPNKTGLLIEPHTHNIVQTLRRVANNRTQLHFIKRHLRHYRADTIHQMVQQYHQLTPLPLQSIGRYPLAVPAADIYQYHLFTQNLQQSLSSVQHQLKQQQITLADCQQNLTIQIEHYHKLSAERDEMRTWAQRLDQHILELQRQQKTSLTNYKALEQERDEMQTWAKSLDKDVIELQRQRQTLLDNYDKLTQECHEIATWAKGLDQDKNNLQQHNNTLTSQITQVQINSHQLQQELDEVYASTSWRLSKPLRSLLTYCRQWFS